MADTLTRHAEAVWQAVVPSLPGFTVEVLPSIDSTSSELMRRARSGLMEPVLLTAEDQTAGRGRLGKGWHSKPGQSLTFSLALPLAPASWSGLSLAVGVSLAHSLHPDVRLKWPNDLWLHQRKIGGILVETASTGEATQGLRMVVIGVGINIARPDVSAVAALVPDGAAAGAMAPAGLAEVLVGVPPARCWSVWRPRWCRTCWPSPPRALPPSRSASRGSTRCRARRCSSPTAPGARPAASTTTAPCRC